MNGSSSTISILTLVTIALLGMCALDYGVIHATIERSQAVQAIAAQNDALTNGESQSDSENTIFASTVAERADLDSYVLAKADQVAFVSELQGLGNITNAVVTINNLGTAAAPAADTGLQYLTADIKVKGSWIQVFHFLTLVETMPYSVTVDPMQLQKNSASGAAGTWNAAFSIKVLTYAQ